MIGEPPSRIARPFLQVVSFLALGACAAERPVSSEPVVVPLPPPPSPREAAFVEALEEVSRLARERDLEEASQRLEALASGEVPEPYGPSVEALRDWIKALQVERDVGGRSSIELPRADFSAGETILARVTLSNPGPRTLHFSSDSRNADERRGMLTVTMRRWGPLGSRDEITYPIPFEPPVGILAAGESAGREILIETPKGIPFALIEVQLAATLLPARVVVDGRPVPVRHISLAPALARVFPPGWEGIAAAPLDSLRRALQAPSPVFDRHVLTAAALVPPAEKEEAIGTCVAALDESNARRQASAMAALQYLSGRTDLPFEPTVWRRWWRLRRGEGGS